MFDGCNLSRMSARIFILLFLAKLVLVLAINLK